MLHEARKDPAAFPAGVGTPHRAVVSAHVTVHGAMQILERSAMTGVLIGNDLPLFAAFFVRVCPDVPIRMCGVIVRDPQAVRDHGCPGCVGGSWPHGSPPFARIQVQYIGRVKRDAGKNDPLRLWLSFQTEQEGMHMPGCGKRRLAYRAALGYNKTGQRLTAEDPRHVPWRARAGKERKHDAG